MPDTSAGAEELQREIERLPEVRVARVVASPSGRILEIHLVSDGTKPPKQLTRDVETVAATQGLDIDRRTISIAQMPDAAAPFAAPGPGLVLSSLSVSLEGSQATCRVRVSRADEDAIGEASAPATPSGRPRLVARATLDAACTLLESPATADCDSALIVDAGGYRLALVLLVLVDQDRQPTALPGVRVVTADPDEAIARAVLDALTRRTAV